VFFLKDQDGYFSFIVSVMHFTLIKYGKHAVYLMLLSKFVAGERGNYYVL